MERLVLAGKKDWRERMERAGIVWLTTQAELADTWKKWNLLPVSRCSAVKGNVSKGTPEQLYRGNQNIRFYQWCKRNRIPYGILSDQYGLVLWNEEREMYDTHPSQVPEEQFVKLAKYTRAVMDRYKRQGFLYHSAPPMTSAPYFHLMLLTGLKVFYLSKLIDLTPKGFGLCLRMKQ